MKFHIWKPEPDRWLIIDTSDGALYDVSVNKKGHYVVSERSPVLDYKTIVKVVTSFEQAFPAGKDKTCTVLNFEMS